MKVYLNRSPYMAPAQDYAIQVHIDTSREQIHAVFATPLISSDGNTEMVSPTFEVAGRPYYAMDEITLDVPAIRKSRSWSDRQVFNCSFDWRLRKWLAPFPSYTFSLPTRFTGFEMMQMYRITKENFMLGFNVPFANATFDECFVTVNLHPEMGGCIVEGVLPNDIEELGYQSHEITREMKFPSVRVKAPNTARADAPVIFDLQLLDGKGDPIFDRDAEIYCEAVNGYLPKTRLMTQSGLAQVKVLPLGLESGDVVRLKAGFKFYPGLDDAQVTLS